jgi:hypothetical protein
MWKNIVQTEKPQITVWSTRIARRIPKAKYAYSEYVILNCFSHHNNGWTNSPQCCFILTLTVLFYICKVHVLSWLKIHRVFSDVIKIGNFRNVTVCRASVDLSDRVFWPLWSAASRLLRIAGSNTALGGHRTPVFCECWVEVSVSGWSLVQRSPTKCNVRECEQFWYGVVEQ